MAQGRLQLLDPTAVDFIGQAHDLSHARNGGGPHREADPLESCVNIMKGVLELLKIAVDGRQQIVGLQFAPNFPSRLWRRKTA